ncbi:hypothetical protein DPSP01_006386 [Paraphaeosphaeria sporulosa]
MGMLHYRASAASALTVRACNTKIDEIDRWKCVCGLRGRGVARIDEVSVQNMTRLDSTRFHKRHLADAVDAVVSMQVHRDSLLGKRQTVRFMCRATQCTTLPARPPAGRRERKPHPGVGQRRELCSASRRLHRRAALDSRRMGRRWSADSVCDRRCNLDAMRGRLTRLELGPKVLGRRESSCNPDSRIRAAHGEAGVVGEQQYTTQTPHVPENIHLNRGIGIVLKPPITIPFNHLPISPSRTRNRTASLLLFLPAHPRPTSNCPTVLCARRY